MSQNIPDAFFFNGVEGSSGEYCLDPCGVEDLAERLRPSFFPRILKAGLEPRNTAEAGWGVVWCEDATEGVRKALSPLIEHRKQSSAFKELEYYRGETVLDFLERYEAGPDSVNPQKVPYYLLIVGSPEHLSFGVQVELAVSRAVGRITFESVESYGRYAENLVAYECASAPLASPRWTLFGVENPDDPLTRLAVKEFIGPLGDKIAGRNEHLAAEICAGADAVKGRLQSILAEPPTFLLTASHGVRFHPGSPRQPTHQGALVCADWPGPKQWKGQGPLPDDHLFTASDVPPELDLSGLIAFHFACYSAGTPRFDELENCAPRAPAPFVSPLPRALLRQGALAVVGHVDLTFEQSFLWGRDGRHRQLEVFDSFFYELARSTPVGSAMRHFGYRHAELATYIVAEMGRVSRRGEAVTIRDLGLWSAYFDARHYILLGDPAARLRLKAPQGEP